MAEKTTTDPLRSGKDTSEGAMARHAGWAAYVMMAAGAALSYLPSVQAGLEENSTIYVICGVVLAVAGLITKLGAALGLAKSRTEIKKALIAPMAANKQAMAASAVTANLQKQAEQLIPLLEAARDKISKKE